VSHDLRAPLRAIHGFARILAEEHAAALPEDAREYLADVLANARQMGQLVDDLLAFARLGKQPLKSQVVRTAALVGQCVAEIQADQRGRAVEVVVGALPDCQGDAGLLKQVWLNLLSNAWKYSRAKEAARVEVGAGPDPDGADATVFFVRDNGAGFDMQYADKLFGVFQRLHRAEEFEGTGVGLAIVQRVVHRHGGRVWADARPGAGATFFFTLPRSRDGR
jgi:light-regulated signal transduction histidine kinase (bacteriophytochrome)